MNEARIIQNTTQFTNEQIKRIIEFVNPMKKAYGFPKETKSLQGVLVRVIKESDRDKEFLDTNINGSYIPPMRTKNRFTGLTIIDKPVVTVVLPNPDTVKFPTYSNFGILTKCEKKGIKLTKELQRELRCARIEGGYSIILYLSLEEYLVHIFAHELKHHYQQILWNSSMWSLWWKSGLTTPQKKILEKEKLRRDKYADRYAVKQLRLWRKLHQPKDAYPNSMSE